MVKELERQQISPSHVLGIIHIGDMDGTFIPDSNIIISNLSSDTEKTRYTDANIHVVNATQIENIRLRNQEKAENHRKMIRINKITISRIEIPYMHLFMSCDTDHLVFNQRNLTQKAKVDLMDDFTDTHDSEAIKALLESHMDVCPNGDVPFRYTWHQIQQGLNSLGRKTNTPLIFSFIEEWLSENKPSETTATLVSQK